MQYLIWKNGITVESGIIYHSPDLIKKRLKQLQGNTLHIINGDVIHVYHNKNNRVTFSHTFVRDGR